MPPALRLYVPYGAGGEADASARNLAAAIVWVRPRQTVEVVNLADDAGAAATRAVARAPADGRTLLLGRVGSVAILPALSPGVAPPATGLTALALLDQAPLVCVVRSSSAIASMPELLAALAAAPGRLRYSTAGPGTLQALAVRHLLALNGLPPDAARPLHLGQGGQATRALLAGEVDFSCNNARSVVPAVQSGALRGLMTTAPGRLKALPRVHNAAELGLRDLQQLQGWPALLGSPGMAPEIVADWRALLQQVAADAQWQVGTEAVGAAPRILAVPDPGQFLRQQVRFYERLVTLLGGMP